jgi:RNA polymerase subunit RPABC4/transcription elongation factor Spt4
LTTFFIINLLFGMMWFFLCFPVASAARRKGRSYGGFFWLSFFFTPILGAILVAILSPVVASPTFTVDPNDPTRASLGGEALVKCPNCSEFIKADAKVCRFCQSDVAAFTRVMAEKAASQTAAREAAEIEEQAQYEADIEKLVQARRDAEAQKAGDRQAFFKKPLVRILIGMIVASIIAGAGFAIYSKVQADAQEKARQATWDVGSPSAHQQWLTVLAKCGAPAGWLKAKTVKLPEGTMDFIRSSDYKHLIGWYPTYPEGCVYFNLVGNKGTTADTKYVQVLQDDVITWTPDWSSKTVESAQSTNYPFVYKALSTAVFCVAPLLDVDTDFLNSEDVSIFPDSAAADLSLPKGHSRGESLASLLTNRAKCFVETFAPINSFTKTNSSEGTVEWVSTIKENGTSWDISVFENPNGPLIAFELDIRKH